MGNNKNFDWMERRLFPRLDANIKVDYFIMGIVPVVDEGSSKDISAGGICILVDENFKTDSVVFLTVHLPDGENPVKVRGRVVRSTEVATTKKQEKSYEAGIAFIKINPDDQERIAKYVTEAK
jgi:c-di-GMP-binding flagellar brake protein YcgR